MATLIGTRTCLHFPTKHFQVFGVTLPLTGLLAVSVQSWRWEIWTSALREGEHFAWWFWPLKGMTLTVVALTLLAWKRSYHKGRKTG